VYSNITWLFAFFNLSHTVGWRSAQACRPQKKKQKKVLHKYPELSVELLDGNGRELGIDRCEKKDLSFRWEWLREWSNQNGRDLVQKSLPAHL